MSSVELSQLVALRAQKCASSSPVVVIGSGGSIPHRLPSMGQLGDWLVKQVVPASDAEENEWILVRTALSAGDHLEQALLKNPLSAGLLEKIVIETWRCVSAADVELYRRVMEGSESFSLTPLLNLLFDTSNYTVDIVTTNYDRMIEYACGVSSIMYSTGFDPGYIQTQRSNEQVMFRRGSQAARTVRLWKVHGSLDWFLRKGGAWIGGNLGVEPIPGVIPQIVSPGVSKYEKTYAEPFRSAIQGADRALEGARGYLCIGFGFRDAHIEPKIVQRCLGSNVPIAVIARTLTDEARLFLKTKAGANYLGIELNGEFSKAYLPEYPEGVALNIKDAWSLGGFMEMLT